MGNKASVRHHGNDSDERVSIDGIDDMYELPVTAVTSDSVKPTTTELPISQAAQALGISERTLWRRIESGRLKSRLKGTKRFVRVPTSEIDGLPSSATDVADTLRVSQVGTLIDIKSMLHELSAAHYRVGYLQSQIEAQDKQLKLLPDLQAQAARALAHELKVSMLENELCHIRKRWWYRICNWFFEHKSNR